jgi:hypothetical protein
VKRIRWSAPILALVVLALMSGTAQAQIAKGNNQLIFNFNFQDSTVSSEGSSDSDSQLWSINGSFGRFFTKHLQASITASAFLSETEGTSSDPSGYLGLRADWHFNPQSTAVFYLGVQGSSYFTGGEDSQNEFGYGGQLGIKAFMRENIFFNAEALYLKTDFDTFEIETTSVLLGIGFQF